MSIENEITPEKYPFSSLVIENFVPLLNISCKESSKLIAGVHPRIVPETLALIVDGKELGIDSDDASAFEGKGVSER